MNGPGRRVRVMDSLNQTPGEDQGKKEVIRGRRLSIVINFQAAVVMSRIVDK